jgi:hypothetical protein
MTTASFTPKSKPPLRGIYERITMGGTKANSPTRNGDDIVKTTQCDRILQYIEDFGSITQLQAIADLGCMRLASRVSDIKYKMGIPIRTRWVSGKNRYGEKTHYAEYYIEKEN